VLGGQTVEFRAEFPVCRRSRQQMSDYAEPELRPCRISGIAHNSIIRHRLPPFSGPLIEPFLSMPVSLLQAIPVEPEA
jgi:hypothetical protein